MQQPLNPRKRPAPGASPMQTPVPPPQGAPLPQTSYPYAPLAENADFGGFDFSRPYTGEATFSEPNPSADSNNLSYLQNSTQPASYTAPGLATPPTSTELVRRSRNQPLVPHPGGSGVQGQWDGGVFNNVNGQPPDEEDEEELKIKVAMAKRDAQGKRKQIPPFVQKLSSFLDSNNTDLIRWSDDGRSFIVLDEDEFARTLIPELFKHNNYASFVRQLNMYGFHKTVNITDGSLRQSEKARKGVKPPSMYSHPYFRRNQPELLWLIQKPNSKTGSKRKREGGVKDYDSDEERQFTPVPGGAVASGGIGPPGELGGPNNANDVATLPRSELAAMRRELQKLQAQQRYISQMIHQLKDQNEQFYRQASAFQALHDRHENSINAILTFLATFYNRSLEGHGAQSLVNLFSNPNQNIQQQGSVEEMMGDGGSENNQMQRFFKKQPLLLPGPVARSQNQQQPGSAHTEPNSNRNSISPPKRESSGSVPPMSGKKDAGSVTSPAIKNDAPTPDLLQSVPESDQMLSLINSVNATNVASTPGTAAPALDFSSALEHYQNANGNAPLTPQQRDNMLSLIAQQQASATSARPDENNALVSPHPPQMPDLGRIRETQQQLDLLASMQRQQDEKVQDLHRRLQPLSPTGSIPGLPGNVDEPFDLTGVPGDYDPNTYFNFDSPWANAAGEDGQDGGLPAGNDLNFDLAPDDNADLNWDFSAGGTGQGDDMFSSPGGMFGTGSGGGQQQAPTPTRTQQPATMGRVESVSGSEATSPATTVQPEGNEEPGTPKKRTKR